MKKRWWLLAAAVLVLGGVGLWQRHEQTQAVSGVPTVFVHGFGGTANSTGQMIQALTQAGVTKQTMRVTVTKTGTLKVKGGLYGQNPSVQVVFQGNRDGRQFTGWLLKVYTLLHRRYHVQRVNAVGHSLGAQAVVEAAMRHPAVKMAHIVAIAGPYDGILGMNDRPHQIKLTAAGKPTPMRSTYRQLLQEAPQFKAQAVLNLYGDLGDGSASDGRVAVNSARSLRYLLRHFEGPYQEIVARGATAQHSKLHQHNATVDKALRRFLFGE
ncbi:MAG: alpha/beta hydrolase [Lactobacillus sp.]|jgi:uncharacterized alpha/beta hydrolase family protein|nr:alpha/beta hydrolase [Lactobacillus sp.]MCI2034254.1 alpha/beta hydrolase [Lactobacillus sp.]